LSIELARIDGIHARAASQHDPDVEEDSTSVNSRCLTLQVLALTCMRLFPALWKALGDVAE